MMKIKTCDVTKQRGVSSDPEGTSDDTRLGTIENKAVCQSCSKSSKDCPGHYGMIDLGEDGYYIHPLFKESLVRFFQSICWKCCKPVLNREELERLNSRDFKDW